MRRRSVENDPEDDPIHVLSRGSDGVDDESDLLDDSSGNNSGPDSDSFGDEIT